MNFKSLQVDFIHTHHETRYVCLSGVWGQVDLFGGSALALRVHHHTVACEACKASNSISLTRCSPVHSERCGANLGELEISRRRYRWGIGKKKQSEKS